MANYGTTEIPVVDSHLDLAENVTLFGRDLTLALAEVRATERRAAQQATVSLPEMRRGGVAVAFATVTAGFLEAEVGADFQPPTAIYRTPQEAEAQALLQLALYEEWARQDLVRLLRTVGDLEDHLALWQDDRTPGLVLLMEGADPIVHVRDLNQWWARGLRMIGLTYGDTKYGSGVGGGNSVHKHGNLTTDGAALLSTMGELGFIWDISHLTEEGVWQGLNLPACPRVCASHANAQALTPTDRHLSDGVIRALGKRDGVIGLVLYNAFLEPRWTRNRTIAVTLTEHLARHASHIATVAGWAHVGIGSDLDGGFGLGEVPAEIDTIADLRQVANAVPLEARDAVLSTNWLRFLRSSLPT